MSLPNVGIRSTASGNWISRLLGITGIALLAVWVFWWGKSYHQDRLASGRTTWVDILPFLAGDFRVHIDHTARLWAEGRNVYRRPCDWVCDLFPYPPMVPRLYTWVSLTSPSVAIAIWLSSLTVILAAGSWASCRTRRSLGLAMVPLPLALAWVLYSSPVLWTLERGQCDGLVVAFLLPAVWLLRRGSRSADLTAGFLLAIAAWTKYYPGLVLLGLVAMRRWRAVAGFVLLGAAVAAYDAKDVRQSIANGLQLMGEKPDAYIHAWEHSIPQNWRALWEHHWHCEFLAQIPADLATAGLLIPLLAWVTLRVSSASKDHCRPDGSRDDRLIYPYFLWLIALGTFAMPYSNDYNLVFLPLGVLAVWDRKDPLIVHMLNGLLMLWWQPFRLSIGGEVLLAIKFAGLAALGMSLVSRAGACGQQRAFGDHRARMPAPRLNIGIDQEAAGASSGSG